MGLDRKFSTALLLLASLAPLCAAEVPCAVPGFERLRAGGGDWRPEAGEVLFSELSCAACHQGRTEPSPSLAWKTGPDLSAAGDRLRAGYVREFLANPSATKPGTTMPSLLAAVAEPQRAEMVEDLTHHLMEQRSTTRSLVEPVAGSAKTGRELFLSVGCVACHGPSSIGRLGEKYAPGELARFLLNPLSVRPAGRMPDQHLGKKDAAHLAAYLAPDPPAADAEFVVDSERAQRGKKAFASLGCAACHESKQVARPTSLVDLQHGCLASEPKAGVPHYSLTDEQRDAIRAALAVRGRAADTDNPKVAIRRVMLQRNCFACHARGGFGGPPPQVAVHFTSTKDDLGDLGRLPPPLDGVGRKFHRAALENVLRGRDPVRRYMRVRMPGFGDDLARQLGALFAKADADPNERPATAKADPGMAGRNAPGRELVGTGGYACIACHDLNGHASLGIGAYDLAEMPKRLRPEWMRDFLLNPAAFPTGARMPPFWPGGVPANPHIGGKDALRQIDSIRVYLTEADESLPPEGIVDRAAFVLQPTERPIIFRTFLKGAGTHAIAVGFPGGVNVAFDALTARWSMAWRGRYLDADGTWNQREMKMEQPLGQDLVHLEETGVLSISGHEGLAAKFRGYRLDAQGVPVFDYDLGALRVEDRVEPTANRGLRRTLRISGQTNESVQLGVHPPAGVTVQMAGGASRSIRLEFHQGAAECVEEIAW